MPGELDFISWLRTQTHPLPNVPIPPGDDLAALNWNAADLLLVGVDQVLDGVHFESAMHSPRAIGRKAMNRNLSDCAAMACLPVAAVIAAALTSGIGLEYARELHFGLREAADAFGCAIVGGDTGSWPGKLALAVTILGRSAGIEPIRRSGAKLGDTIYVTGPLGGSRSGRHMTFQPRIMLARKLAASGVVHAMIDISDGLARDLAHLCRESRLGAIIDLDQIPIHEDVRRLGDTLTPVEHALGDGEDYELLLSGPAGSNEPGVTPIGIMTSEPGIFVRHAGRMEPLARGGWEHAL